LAVGVPPVEVITKGLAVGLRIVGEKFERHECFLAD
jgi:methanogenic corrinoid protein MtbC1